jgi:hypothetical protein
MSDRRIPRALHVDPIYPGNGLPPRPGEDRPGLSPFGRLAMGQVLGHSSILVYDSDASGVQDASVDMINVEGDDLDALQLVVTLHPPRVIPIAFEEVGRILAQQNLTGEQSTAEVAIDHFPGTKHSIRWPPLEATVEFGVGGVATKVVVDYLNGVTFTVPSASFLRVSALVTQSKEDGDITGTSAAYYLAAHVGPGFAESHAQRTIFVGHIDNRHESEIFDVPKFAKVATLIGTREHHRHRQPILSVGWIRFWQSPDGHEGVSDAFISDGQSHVEVPNAAQYFSVYNESGHKMKMAAIFELAL